MTVSIIQRTDAFETEKRLVITNDAARRKIEGGSSWNKIRLGVDLSSSQNSNWTAPPSFYFGLMSGTENPPFGATTNHFLGIKSSAANWTWYNGNGGINIHGLAASRIVNGIESSTNVGVQGGTGSNAPIIGYHTQRKYPFIIEITKGSPNYTIDIWAATALNSFWERYSTASKFAANMSAPSVIVNNSNLFYHGQATFAVDEATNGTLDTLVLAWPNTTPTLEASNIQPRILS